MTINNDLYLDGNHIKLKSNGNVVAIMIGHSSVYDPLAKMLATAPELLNALEKLLFKWDALVECSKKSGESPEYINQCNDYKQEALMALNNAKGVN